METAKKGERVRGNAKERGNMRKQGSDEDWKVRGHDKKIYVDKEKRRGEKRGKEGLRGNEDEGSRVGRMTRNEGTRTSNRQMERKIQKQN